MTIKKEPTAEQLEVLKAFAAKYGRTWKAVLRDAWITGRDEREPNSALLRQVRNQLGPRWLVSFRLS